MGRNGRELSILPHGGIFPHITPKKRRTGLSRDAGGIYADAVTMKNAGLTIYSPAFSSF